ncbi:MAG: BglII/BstYI family type II restriction endonuclease [Bacteroidota bacterium]
MFVSSIISNLGGWDKLQQEAPDSYAEIRASIAGIQDDLVFEDDHKTISLPSLYKSFRYNLMKFEGWQQNLRLHLGQPQASRILSEIDFAKGDVGVDLFFDRAAYLESYLFAKIPYFIRARHIRIAVLLIPSQELAQKLPSGVVKFSHIRQLLAGFPILPLKYPFVIMGLTDQEPEEIKEYNLNTALDVYLLEKMDKSLNEILVEGEAEAYDFKIQLPKNEKVAQEVCGFANREGGGLLLFGITDDGLLEGMPAEDWDDIQLKLSSIISSSCSPSPEFQIHRFPVPERRNRIIIVLEIKELKLKPCMTRHRVYIRKSASVRPANSEDIRRLLIR